MAENNGRGRRLLRWISWLTAGVVVVVAGLVAIAAVARQRPRTLPGPTGTYAVGRSVREWTDTARRDPLAPQPDQRRALSVWIWYPADSRSGAPSAYAPGLWANLRQQGFLAGPLEAIRTSEYDDAPVADGRFPLIILEPGLGLSAPHFTTLAQEVASHGYIVAGVTPTYSANVTVLGGKVVGPTDKGKPDTITDDVAAGLVDVWAADARFAAKRVATLEAPDLLSGHIDTAHTVYIGHSLGGASSLQACHDDQLCVGAADLDGTPYGPVRVTGLTQPFLVLGSQDGCLTIGCSAGANTEQQQVQSAARQLYAASTGPSWRYAVDGAQHFNFTDYGAYFLLPPVQHLLGQLGSIDGRRALEITNACVLAFVDHVLRSSGSPDHLRDRFPELHANS